MFEKQKQAREEKARAKSAAVAAGRRAHDEQELASLVDRLDTVKNYTGVRAGEGVEIPIVLKRDERMLASLQGAALIEPRRGAGKWEGKSQGLSVRVPGTKSMRYRLGATRGHYVQGEERPTPIDTGTFTITDRRAVFAGENQTREWAWAKLISVTHASDLPWTAISVSNRQKTSGVLYDAAHADIVRFWLDLGIARGTEGVDALEADLQGAIAQARATVAAAPPLGAGSTPSALPVSDVAQETAVSAGAGQVATSPSTYGGLTYIEGTQRVEAVGESHYQDALTALCGGLSHDGHELETVAQLVPEPSNNYDVNAVEVRISDRVVGYLSRELAASVSPRLQRRTPAGLAVRAWIRGGWDRGDDDTGMFGVVVLLPELEDL
jgi:HIRAN domain